jgi:thymidylate synthase
METNKANDVWQETLARTYNDPHYVASPRGMEVHERLGDGYGPIPMPAYIDLEDRKVNSKFMHREAAWIIEGSNKLADLTEVMKSYANYSDDGLTLSGAYGPKVVDQYRYVVDSIEADNATRQAVMNIWRERPGPSKDIPCTLSMQFIMRQNEEGQNRLNSVVTMRSNDIVLGYTYDVYSFSMVANAVRLMLQERGIDIPLDENGNFGDLFVNPGSLHIYERHYDKVEEWTNAKERDTKIGEGVMRVMQAQSYPELIELLKKEAKTE